MYRKFRRLVLRKFGGYKKFAVCVILGTFLVIVYYYKSAVLPTGSFHRQVWDGDPLHKNVSGAPCGVICPRGQIPFSMKTGQGMTLGPSLCYNGKLIFSPDLQNVGRGINTVFIDPTTLEVKDTQTFDTYMDVYPLLRYAQEKVPLQTLIMAVSFDEISEGLKEEGRSIFAAMGSSLISKVHFRDAYLLVGQMGLKKGHAIEFHKSRETSAFASPIEKQGCFNVPMGPIGEIVDYLPSLQPAGVIQKGRELRNCGIEAGCSSGTFSVMLDTGESDKVTPKICVSGQIVVDKQLNDAGRGINLVVVDHVTHKVKAVSRFDTYLRDSLNLEFFLDKLEIDDIIVAVVNDDGSRKLSLHAKELFNQLGSSMVQNLKFRDVWYFVGQKGISGFTKHEQISYAGYDGEWPKILHSSFCVPSKLQGLKVAPDPGSHRNEGRRAFCKKYDGYADFCEASHIDEAITPVSVVDKNLAANPVYDVPIIIIPGLDHNALVRTLETTLMQPGVKPSHVTVMWDEKTSEHAELADLFGYHNYSLISSIKYTDQVSKAVKAGWELHNDVKYMIILEEELILAPDFLSFLGQSLTVLDKDPTLLAVSAWNYNGYDTTSGDRSLAYRVEEFPGLGFLLKRSVYDTYMKERMSACCSDRVWDGWPLAGDEVVGEVLIPDVSRIFRQPYQTSQPDEDYLTELFHKPRLTNLEGSVYLKGLDQLSEKNYEALIHQKLSSSDILPSELLKKCMNSKDSQLRIPSNTGPSFAIYFEQTGPEDYLLWVHLCKCFGLYAYKGHKPRNLHRNIVRFYFAKREGFLVGSAALDYYRHKPTNHKALTPGDAGHH